MSRSIASIRSFVAQEEGATMVEYGLMVALIALVCIGAVALVGTQLQTLFNDVKNSLSGT